MRATRTAVNGTWDVVPWSSHGALISAEWLACMLRQALPGVVLLSACFSGLRDDTLHSLAESLSQLSIARVGIWVGVEDRAAVVYDVEFLRAHVSGRSVAVAHRVAVAQVAIEYPKQVGAAFLLPGLVNGYSRIEPGWGSSRERNESCRLRAAMQAHSAQP